MKGNTARKRLHLPLLRQKKESFPAGREKRNFRKVQQAGDQDAGKDPVHGPGEKEDGMLYTVHILGKSQRKRPTLPPAMYVRTTQGASSEGLEERAVNIKT